MRSKYFYLLVAVAVCLTLVVSGCGMIAEKATEKATEKAIENASGGTAKVDLSSKDGSLEIKGNDGSSMKVGGTYEWPKTIPSDVPKFTYGKITSVMETNADKGKSFFIGYENIDVASYDKYKGELESAGWKITLTSKSETGYLISATKDKRNIAASFSDKDGAVTYTEETTTTPKP